MLVGDPARFAIESAITQAYAHPGRLALGYFILHIGGRSYGVRAPDATWLAVPFDVVEERVRNGGTHRASFASHPDGALLFDALATSIFADPEDEDADTLAYSCCGMSRAQLDELMVGNALWWPAPDEAFDDGTSLFHFDEGDRVRLLVTNEGDRTSWRHNPETFQDVWLNANDFYQVLRRWTAAFMEEWSRMPKIGQTDEDSKHTR